ncbi:hypothetical protein C3733_16270 [Bacillus amyloliquefaciens]|nr:hypothetical protein C3733_16270 [Bacillus amyloliquefaciens]
MELFSIPLKHINYRKLFLFLPLYEREKMSYFLTSFRKVICIYDKIKLVGIFSINKSKGGKE